MAPVDPDSFTVELSQPDPSQARLTQTTGSSEHFLINLSTVALLKLITLWRSERHNHPFGFQADSDVHDYLLT